MLAAAEGYKNEDHEESEEERAKYESRYNQQYEDQESMYEKSDHEEADGEEDNANSKLKMTKMDKLQSIKIAKAKEIQDLGQQIEVEI